MNNSPLQQLQHLFQKQTENYDPIELLHELQKLELRVGEEIISKSNENTFKSANELSRQSIEKILMPAHANKNSIYSRFIDLDKLTHGFVKGEFIVVGARPAVGKTQFLINLCKNIAESGTECAYFSLDLSEEALMYRLFSNQTRIGISRIITGRLNEEQTSELSKAADMIGKLPIFIDSAPVYNILTLTEKCRKLITEKNVKAIFIDYLQLINGGNKRNNRETEISLICRDLKNIAKEFGVCVFISSQLSRAVEQRGGSKRPQLSDLRDSGAIEESADKVLFLYSPEMVGITVDENGESTRGYMEVILAKNRNGRVGSVPLTFDDDFTGFTDFKGYLPPLEISKERLDELN
jgi:replicative DNA helicase